MACFFSACLEDAAEKMGEDQFLKTVAEPADNALSKALKLETMELKLTWAEERGVLRAKESLRLTKRTAAF